MTIDKMRMAVAEACGWVWYRLPHNKFKDGERLYRCLFLPAVHEYEGQSPQWLVRADGSERLCNLEYMWKDGMVPNYPKSLDAMHEAEKELREPQVMAYILALRDIVEKVDDSGENGIEMTLVHVTAAQRCEAFLKTVGKWQNSDYPTEKR